MSDPGHVNVKYKIDPRTGKYAIDWSTVSEEDIFKLLRASKDDVAKAQEVLRDLLPAAAAQALLDRGAIKLYESLIRLAKRAPERLLEIIGA